MIAVCQTCQNRFFRPSGKFCVKRNLVQTKTQVIFLICNVNQSDSRSENRMFSWFKTIRLVDQYEGKDFASYQYQIDVSDPGLPNFSAGNSMQ